MLALNSLGMWREDGQWIRWMQRNRTSRAILDVLRTKRASIVFRFKPTLVNQSSTTPGDLGEKLVSGKQLSMRPHVGSMDIIGYLTINSLRLLRLAHRSDLAINVYKDVRAYCDRKAELVVPQGVSDEALDTWIDSLLDEAMAFNSNDAARSQDLTSRLLHRLTTA